MSSDHVIIVARNVVTDQLELPLGDDMTLYSNEAAEEMLITIRLRYSSDWVLTVYKQYGHSYVGEKS